ncbi:MAG: hypothetical protein WD894_25075 [Pirellulales bacterium]
MHDRASNPLLLETTIWARERYGSCANWLQFVDMDEPNGQRWWVIWLEIASIAAVAAVVIIFAMSW